MLRNNLIFTQGKYILLFALIAIIGSYFLSFILFAITLGFLLFAFYFFRNPDRVNYEALTDDSLLISPADGKVVAIEQGDFEGFTQRVSIFLSPFDVHVNWIPVSGVIEKQIYRPGKFAVAFAPKSSEINERNDILIRDAKGRSILVRQIAGIIARRIIWWVKEGDHMKSGQKYGMIRFGSRVDILLPKQVDIQLIVGQRVYGGQSIVGRWLC